MKNNHKILDMRCRPPYGNFMYKGPNLYFSLYDEESIEGFLRVCGSRMTETVKEKSMDLFFQEMDESGIDIGLLPVRAVTGSNHDEIITLLNQYPDRFISTCGIDPNIGIEKTIQLIDKLVVHGPFKGVGMEPILDSKLWLPNNREMMYPIYEKLQEENIPLMLTTGLYDDFGRNVLLGIDEAAGDFPNLNFIAAHGGWPFADLITAIAETHPNVYISPDLYFVNSGVCQTYIQAANHSCSKQILFGSAFPGCEMKYAVDFYMAHLRDEVIDDVLYNNAARLFGLGK